MACVCENPDGSLSERCSGTCTQTSFKHVDAVQERSDKSIEDRVEYILGVFLNRLNDRIRDMEILSMEKWREGFISGYQQGREDL